MELILPSLFSELHTDALKNIVNELKKIKFLNHIIIGLDKADKEQYLYAKNFFSVLNIPHSILWNDGPNIRKLHDELVSHNLGPIEDGKGKNVWSCIGYSLGRNTAEAIAFHDCDIKTYSTDLLVKLLYPVVSSKMTYDFSKGYYPRYANGKINGRVTRLLVTPLIKSLEIIFGNNDYLNYIDSFRYPLAGEFALRRNLLKNIRIPSDWGLEIGILSELQRNHSNKACCQVDLANQYDHKHQDLSADDDKSGLSRMSVDITKALIRKMATIGYTFNEETFRSLKATYFRKALEFIDIYKDEASFNGLSLDLNEEEKTVELFAENIIKAGKYFLEQPMDTPFIPSWQRVEHASPGFINKLRKAVIQDNEI